MSRPLPNLRWRVAGLLCLSTGLNYLDRQTLSVLATTIQKDLGMSTKDYSRITFAFLISYMVMYAVSGRLIDRIGIRRGLLVFVSAWSGANMLHALARSTGQLTFFRVLLGATEAANMPACVKAVSEWFPVRERALAAGVFNAGVAIGNALAVPLVGFVALAYGWRFAFVVTGALGLVWVVAWAIFYRDPAEHPRLGDDERRLIAASEAAPTDQAPVPLSRLLRMRETWGCLLARMLTDPISYFLYFWIPKYLQEGRGLSLKDVAAFAWIPFVAMAAGSVAGGAIPRALAARGFSVDRARKSTMGLVTLGIPVCCFLITRVDGAAPAVALVAALMFGHAAWGNITLPAEVFPRRVVGTVSGLGGALGALAGALTQLGIGSVAQSVGYTPIFAAASVLYVSAFLVVAALVPNLGRIRTLEATS